MKSLSTNLTRRHFLRGAGVALGLPWLESIRSWGAPASSIEPAAPRRAAVVFMGNGVNPHHWGAVNGATGMEFKDSLRPLEALKEKILVLKACGIPQPLRGQAGTSPR